MSSKQVEKAFCNFRKCRHKTDLSVNVCDYLMGISARMKTAISKRDLVCRYFFLLFSIYFITSYKSSALAANSDEINTETSSFNIFQQALGAADDARAALVGDSIFRLLEQKYGNDANLVNLGHRLSVSESLTKKMVSQLKEATNKLILSVTSESFGKKKSAGEEKLLQIAPAKSLYEEATNVFSALVNTGSLENREKAFLAQYYDLKLKIFISATAEAGQSLAIAEPTFKGMHDYVLVLLLLNASKENLLNVSALPLWMRRPEQLDVLSDSCLSHFDFPYHAMMLAKQSAKIRKNSFSELDFYRFAAKRLRKSRPHIAVDCLGRAMNYISDQNSDAIVDLQFDMTQIWLESENYAGAAGQALKIFETYPNHKRSCEAAWLAYYALSKSNNIDRILADIDTVLVNKRCLEYEPKFMYIKWHALRQKPNEAARIAAIEYQLLKQYGSDPVVAPVLLAQGIDLLDSGDYNGAYHLLTQLLEKFPNDSAATQAKKILVELKPRTEKK